MMLGRIASTLIIPITTSCLSTNLIKVKNHKPIKFCEQKITYYMCNNSECSEQASDEDYEILQKSVGYWTKFLNKEHNYDIIGNRINIFLRIQEIDAPNKDFYALTKTFKNGNCIRYAVIKINRNSWSWMKDDVKETVIRHELGHAFGLSDTDLNGLMFRTILLDKKHPVDLSEREVKAIKCMYEESKD